MHGRVKVYIDPYFGGSSIGDELCTVGYKGSSPYDAGIFYCPYVPLQMVRAIGQDTFQPKIGFKTRYGMVANPFATSAGDGAVTNNATNIYYRILPNNKKLGYVSLAGASAPAFFVGDTNV
jgi:hypothetical protein